MSHLDSFNITWRNGAYYVSVPNYQGGTVYTEEHVERLRKLLGIARDLIEGLLGFELGSGEKAMAFLEECSKTDEQGGGK